MSEFLITCVSKSLTLAGHRHIVSVGIGDKQYYVAAIYQAMNDGHTFRTVSPTSGQLTPVAKYRCCGLDTLRSLADQKQDDNLDNLPGCS